MADPAPTPRVVRQWTVEPWAGGAVVSGVGRHLAEQHTRHFATATARLDRPIGGSGRVAWMYVATVTPLAVATGTRIARPTPDRTAGGVGATPQTRAEAHRTALGAGMQPIGAAGEFPRGARTRARIGVATGVLWFSEVMPRPGSARWNGATSADLTLRTTAGRRHTLSLGYTVLHISNGGLRPVNPGLNSHIVSVGLSRR